MQKILHEINSELGKLEELIKKVRMNQEICQKICLEIPEVIEVALNENFPGKKELKHMEIARNSAVVSMLTFFEIDAKIPFSQVMDKVGKKFKRKNLYRPPSRPF